jgi:hypothetical protein
MLHSLKRLIFRRILGRARALAAKRERSGTLRVEILENRLAPATINTLPYLTITPAPCNDNYYPNASTALTAVSFNESDMLAGISPDGTTVSLADGTLKVFYTDEHAMALGVRQVSVNGVTTNYSVSTTPGANGRVQVGAPYTPPANPETATPASVGLQGGTDVSGRPLGPALYVTDITGLDSNSVAAHADDWQYGGTPIAPNAVYGPTKAFSETISNRQVSLTADSDPAMNDPSQLPDPFPSGVQSEGYATESTWNIGSLGLTPGHSYRFYVMVHDGDQNKSGGDAGQACVNLVYIGNSVVSTITPLNDSAALSAGNNPTGNVTFHLFSPGVTPNANLSNAVYTDVVPVNGNGAYITFTMGNNPGGYQPTTTGTYQWVAVYSGDSNNNSVTSPFGSEPQVVTVVPPKAITPTVTLTTPTHAYDAAAYDDASYTVVDQTNSNADVSGDGTTTIHYYTTSAAATAGTASDTNTTAPTNAGTYYAVAFFTSDGHLHSGTTYLDASSTVESFTISKVDLTVIANNLSKYVDAPNPTLTFKLTGFVGTDSSGVVSGSPTLSTKATPTSPAGIYPITVLDAGNLSANNYAFPAANFVNGTLAIDYPPPKVLPLPAGGNKKGGSVLPISLQVVDANGMNIGSPSLQVQALAIGTSSTYGVGTVSSPPPSPGNSQPGALFTYSSGTYQFNLKLEANGKALAPGTYSFFYTISNDPTATVFSIQFTVT